MTLITNDVHHDTDACPDIEGAIRTYVALHRMGVVSILRTDEKD